MSKKKKTEDLYSEHKTRIDTIVRLMDGNCRKAGRVVTWLYGGSSETWRKFLTRRKPDETVPEDVEELLIKLGGKGSPAPTRV